MATRKKTIENHLRAVGITDSLLEEACFAGYECSKKFTKLTKVCAGVGLIVASKKRGLKFTFKKVSEMLGVKKKVLFKYYSKVSCGPRELETRKIPKLDEMLEMCQVKPEIREKSYYLIENKHCKTPLQAINKAYFSNGLLAPQQSDLLLAKHNKNHSLQKIELRLKNMLYDLPYELDSIPCINSLQQEKDILSKALNISYVIS